MKYLFVINGETFRSGGQMTRGRGIGDYYRRQLLASISHLKLYQKIVSSGHTVDTIVDTYKLNARDDESLVDFYRKNLNLISHNLRDSISASEAAYLKSIYQCVLEKIKHYDCVIIFRIDYFLKANFIEKFESTEKIVFTHIDANTVLDPNKFSTNHVIIIYPRQYEKNIRINMERGGIFHHGIVPELISTGLSLNDIEFMIPTLHVCSTNLGWNPYYIQVGRDYSRRYDTSAPHGNTYEHYFDRSTNTFVKDTAQTTDFYKCFLDDDSLEENLTNLTIKDFSEI